MVIVTPATELMSSMIRLIGTVRAEPMIGSVYARMTRDGTDRRRSTHVRPLSASRAHRDRRDGRGVLGPARGSCRIREALCGEAHLAAPRQRGAISHDAHLRSADRGADEPPEHLPGLRAR